MNNNFFSLVRYLQDRGYDAELLLLNELDHFTPEADSFSEDYKNYTTQLTWMNTAFEDIDPARIRKDVERFDFIIGCGYAPAFLAKAGIQLDLFLPYGSDFYELPFQRKKLRMSANPWQMKTNHTVWKKVNEVYKCQYEGIRTVRHLLTVVPPDFGEKDLAKYGPDLKKRMEFGITPMIYLPSYENYLEQEEVKASAYFKKFAEARDKYDFLIFCQTRHNWFEVEDIWADKGNDILIYGYADFVKNNPELNAGMILFEYGDDVAKSKELIAQLGLTDRVEWFPTMKRKELMIGVAIADVCAGQLRTGVLMYGSLIEILAMGKPVLANRKLGEEANDYPWMYPLLQSETRAKVTSNLQSVLDDAEQIGANAVDGRRWLQECVIDQSMGIIERMIKDKTKA